LTASCLRASPEYLSARPESRDLLRVDEWKDTGLHQ
jgi:hypothetical protein